jgi:glycosyl transferase family 25
MVAESKFFSLHVNGVEDLNFSNETSSVNAPAVFIINLDGSDKRLAQATTQLEAVDAPFKRISAFDGRDLDPESFAECDTKRFLNFMGRPIRGGEVGCYLSHVYAAQSFLSSGAAFGLVLEDDFRFLPSSWVLILELCKWAETHSDDWDVINLGHNRHKIFTQVHQFTDVAGHTMLTRAHYFPMTTNALFWSVAGATAFIAEHDKIFAPVDNYLRHWQTRRGRGLAVWPPIISISNAESEISNAHARRSKDGQLLSYGLLKQRRLITDKAFAYWHLLRFRIRSWRQTSKVRI